MKIKRPINGINIKVFVFWVAIHSRSTSEGWNKSAGANVELIKAAQAKTRYRKEMTVDEPIFYKIYLCLSWGYFECLRFVSSIDKDIAGLPGQRGKSFSFSGISYE